MHKVRFARLQSNSVNWPLWLFVGVSVICLASYLVASPMMRPIGDDYDWLNRFYLTNDWLGSLKDMLATNNGRYSQNVFVAVAYGLAGPRLMLVTGFLATSVFIAAMAAAVATLTRTVLHKSLSFLHALPIAIGLFASYTAVSVTFPWIKGAVDNSLQNFLWYGGFVTYTLPFSLLILLVCAIIDHPRFMTATRWRYGLLLATGVLLGIFNESLFLIALIPFGLWVVYAAALNRKLPRSTAVGAIGATLLGLFIGVLLIYTSPASTSRRKIITTQSPTSQILAHSATRVPDYLHSYVATDVATLSKLLVPLTLGATLAITLRAQQKRDYLERARRTGLIGAGLLITYTLALFVSFVLIFKGYGLLQSTYLVPRLEVLYNTWLVGGLACIGFAGASLASFFAYRRLVLVSFVVLLFALWSVPILLLQSAQRVKIVAVFSTQWDQQQKTIDSLRQQGQTQIQLPSLDIGDAYGAPCDPAKTSWLRDAKSQYFGVHLCDPPSL